MMSREESPVTPTDRATVTSELSVGDVLVIDGHRLPVVDRTPLEYNLDGVWVQKRNVHERLAEGGARLTRDAAAPRGP